jgi:hypothetical protein
MSETTRNRRYFSDPSLPDMCHHLRTKALAQKLINFLTQKATSGSREQFSYRFMFFPLLFFLRIRYDSKTLTVSRFYYCIILLVLLVHIAYIRIFSLPGIWTYCSEHDASNGHPFVTLFSDEVAVTPFALAFEGL